MITGNACLNFLADKTKEKDMASSSFWDHYHTSFSHDGEQFYGLEMLGSYKMKPKTSFKKKLIEAKHRIFQAPYRNKAYDKVRFKKIDKIAENIAKVSGQEYGVERLRHTLILDVLMHFIPGKMVKDSKACVIGDGFATMSALLIASESVGQVFMVNLNKSLLVDLVFIKKILSDSEFEESVCLVTDKESLLVAVNSKKKIVAIMASDYELLQFCPIDIAINMASMQEMDKSIVQNYFHYLRVAAQKRDVFLYCNNRELKILPDGQVIKFSEFPWSSFDEILLDELCSWNQKYYSMRPPFYHPYDGFLRHRLARLAPAK